MFFHSGDKNMPNYTSEGKDNSFYFLENIVDFEEKISG